MRLVCTAARNRQGIRRIKLVRYRAGKSKRSSARLRDTTFPRHRSVTYRIASTDDGAKYVGCKAAYTAPVAQGCRARARAGHVIDKKRSPGRKARRGPHGEIFP